MTFFSIKNFFTDKKHLTFPNKFLSSFTNYHLFLCYRKGLCPKIATFVDEKQFGIQPLFLL